MLTMTYRALGGVVGVLSLILIAVPAPAQDVGIPEHEPMPMPVPRPHPVIQRDLTLTSMSVNVEIRGATAQTTIRQTLRNDGHLVAEGKYMLPLPAGATVAGFAIIDGDQRLEGEVLDAQTARRTYQEIVRQMRDPGLLEYQDSRTFSVSIFPFQPGQSRTVEVKLSQALTGTTELVQYALPLRWAGWSRCLNTSFVLTYSIESNHDLGTVSSPTHGISVNRDGNRRVHGSYEATVSDFPSDFTLNMGRRTGDFAASLMCFPGEGGEDGFFILSLLEAMPADEKYIPKDVQFIFDKSGSMSGEKIEQAKGALRYVLGQLKSDDRFGLIYYSDNVDTVFEGLRTASSDNTREARRFVGGLTAEGGTDINTALTTGAAMLKPDGRPTYVIFLTDGLPTVGDTNIDHIINNAKRNFHNPLKLFVFGVGYDVNTTLLDSLSYNHHGSATYVSPDEDIEVKVSQFYAKMSSPALVNLKVNFAGLDTYDLMPREMPDLFHNNEIFITGRYRGNAASSVVVSVNGETNEGRRTLKTTIGSNRSAANHQVPRLWATRKVSYMLDQIRLHGDDAELLGEVDRLAMRYGIVTPYTSYLITEPGMYFDARERRAHLEEEMLFARDDQSGARAVGRSKMNQQNIAGDVAAAPQQAGAAAGGERDAELYGGIFSIEPMLSSLGTTVRGSADPYSTVNYVHNQTFVRQGAQWVDARYEADQQEVVKITTYGETYFDLLDEFPELGDYLSQGEAVVLVVARDLVLETTLDEVVNTSAELSRLRKALGDSDYLSDSGKDGALFALGAVGQGGGALPGWSIGSIAVLLLVVSLLPFILWFGARRLPAMRHG
ncbi:VWA domain-containing protein [bacterium]|nr:VWA domain-containing protein [bacterium]